MDTILITGGAGFIGSHVIRHFVNKYPNKLILNVDKLTYAGNLENLSDVEGMPNYLFSKLDICDAEPMKERFSKHNVCGVIHLAAESHVDRSITDPLEFIRTNIVGTATLLEAARQYWEGLPEGYEGKMFYYVSTDEVYGSLGPEDPKFNETMKYDPHSPYSASKASADHLVRSYHDTYGMPTVISHCSNNYGPYQFPEKLIPLVINNIVNKKPIPIYGDGKNVRDWLYVEEHVKAIDTLFNPAFNGETFNIGGDNEMTNIDIVRKLIAITDRLLGRQPGEDDNLITFVKDRKGHDKRYAIDATKLMTRTNWKPSGNPDTLLEHTVKWYLDNKTWVDKCTSGEYQQYYELHYKSRIP